MNTKLKQVIEAAIGRIPRIGAWRQAFLRHSTPGHFYSPIPDREEIKRREAEVFNKDIAIYGIDFNDEVQLDFLDKIKPLLPEAPWKFEKQENLAFRYDNIYYTYSDALTLYGLMRILRPGKIIEVGSGWSSAVMLDTNRLFCESKTRLLFIEPYPDRLMEVKKETDPAEHWQVFIQQVDLDVFRKLNNGDFLFIDTSHVSKIGSDVNFILFELLPVLKKGVYVHFHDIHFPFEYPKKWIYEGYAWNENYVLRAYLTNNADFEIVFMNTYLEYRYPEKMPEMLFTNYNNSITGSIWLRKKQ